MRLSLLAFLLFSFSSFASAEPAPWRRIEHKVEEGETLRLLALRYLGVRAGSTCLQSQLQLPDPNTILAGTRLSFFVPLRIYSYPEFQALTLECAQDQVRVDGQPVVMLARAPTPEPSEDEAPDPESLFELKRIATVRFGTGMVYADADQSLSDSEGVGRSSYKDVQTGNIWAMARYAWNRRWAVDAQYESIPGHWAGDAGFAGPAYRWNTAQGSLLYQARRLRFGVLGARTYTLVRAGVARPRFPLTLPREIGNTSKFTVETVYASAWEGKLGLGWITLWTLNWSSEFALNFGSLVAPGDFKSVDSTYMLDGYLLLERRAQNGFGIGLQWHGQAAEFDFQTAELDGQSQLFYSALELFFSYGY